MVYTTYKAGKLYPDGPLAYWTRYDAKTIDRGGTVASNVCLCFSTASADLLMLWRLFVIWSDDRRVIYLPILLLLYGVANCSTIITYDVLSSSRFDDPIFTEKYKGISAMALAVDLILTWYITGLICYRLWSVEQQKRAIGLGSESAVSSGPRSRYGKIMVALIQSGMLYSMTEAALLVVVVVDNSDVRDIINGMNTRIIGISTVLIILQLNTGANGQRPPRTAPSAFSMPVFRIFPVEGQAQIDTDQSNTALAVEKEQTSNTDTGLSPEVDGRFACDSAGTSSSSTVVVDSMV
ncbi:hypothetical protein FRB94_004944 [Tulasnella sp. JGI-2019a]|nr:hypothetical protein FRB94_004944 [Tulasnella sp. JGI-2019a]